MINFKAVLSKQLDLYFKGETENQGAIIDVYAYVLKRFDTPRNANNQKAQNLFANIKAQYGDHLKFAYPLHGSVERAVSDLVIKAIR